MRAREVGLRGKPLGEGGELIRLKLVVSSGGFRRFPEEARDGGLAGARVGDIAFAGEVNNLLALEFMFVEAVVAIVREHLVINARKDVRPVVVVGLRPAVEGMVWHFAHCRRVPRKSWAVASERVTASRFAR